MRCRTRVSPFEDGRIQYICIFIQFFSYLENIFDTHTVIVSLPPPALDHGTPLSIKVWWLQNKTRWIMFLFYVYGVKVGGSSLGAIHFIDICHIIYIIWIDCKPVKVQKNTQRVSYHRRRYVYHFWPRWPFVHDNFISFSLMEIIFSRSFFSELCSLGTTSNKS